MTNFAVTGCWNLGFCYRSVRYFVWRLSPGRQYQITTLFDECGTGMSSDLFIQNDWALLIEAVCSCYRWGGVAIPPWLVRLLHHFTTASHVSTAMNTPSTHMAMLWPQGTPHTATVCGFMAVIAVR